VAVSVKNTLKKAMAISITANKNFLYIQNWWTGHGDHFVRLDVISYN